jgi:hypothetical protein
MAKLAVWAWKSTRKGVNLFNAVNDVIPKLLTMAAQFESNGGTSLKDQVGDIARRMAERDRLMDHVEKTAAEAAVMAREAKELSQEVSDQITEWARLNGETHSRVYEAAHTAQLAIERIPERTAERVQELTAERASSKNLEKNQEPQRVVIANEAGDPVRIHEGDGRLP